MIAGMGAIAVFTALELGVFGELRRGPRTVAELAEATESAERGMEALTSSLLGLNYLERDGDTYRLTQAADKGLPDRDLELIGAFARDQLRRTCDAVEAVRKAPEDGIVGWEVVQGGEVGQGYQAAMRWLASDLVEPVVAKAEVPDSAERFLDIGGSHGLYTVGFCREHDLSGAVLDWPIGLENAEQTLKEHPDVADRIELIEGDFEEDDELPSGYDVAFLGNIVHGLEEAGNRELFSKIARATNEQGTLAIVDQVEDPPSSGFLPFDPTDSSFARGIASLVGWNLFLFSGGRAHAYDDLAAWLADAGFPEVTHKPLRESPGFSLIVARK